MLVIDTNVLAIAEGMNSDASDECIAGCLSLLRQIREGSPLVVDEGDAIFLEYLGTLRRSGTSGVAAKLVDRLYRTRHGGVDCLQVAITPRAAPPGVYEEVPDSLRDFDDDDQKFIAVAVAAAGRPPIAVGLDGDWWDRRADFAAAGVDVQFVCLADLIAADGAARD